MHTYEVIWLLYFSHSCIAFKIGLHHFPKAKCETAPDTHSHLPSAGGCELKNSDQTISKSLRALYKELGGQKRKIKVEIKKKIGLSPTLLPCLSLRRYNTKHYMVIGICFCCHFDK